MTINPIHLAEPMTTIHLDPAQVPAALRGGYAGKMFKAVIAEAVTIPVDAGLWSGGSRETYNGVRVADGASIPFPGQQEAPWGAHRQERRVDLRPGFAVVRHSMFCGKDMGLTFYLHPTDAAPMLPAPAAELDPVMQLVLNYTRSRKSSYAGKDRYAQMADDNAGWRHGGATPPFIPTRDEWNLARERLVARGLLNKAGAITPAGRNVAKSV